MSIQSVCVYCGSSSGYEPVYADSTRSLGALLAANNLRLVYGGGSVGLMGILADEVLRGGGQVVGVIPRNLFSREIAHTGLTELIEVDSMHQRKQLMYEFADAFIALPGGLGTIEELAEITTWAQLGLHLKPIVLLDVNGYWTGLVDLLDRAVRDGFLREENRALLTRVSDVADVLDVMKNYRAPAAPKWIDASET